MKTDKVIVERGRYVFAYLEKNEESPVMVAHAIEEVRRYNEEEITHDISYSSFECVKENGMYRLIEFHDDIELEIYLRGKDMITWIDLISQFKSISVQDALELWNTRQEIELSLTCI